MNRLIQSEFVVYQLCIYMYVHCISFSDYLEILILLDFRPIPVNIIVMLLFQMLVTKFLFTQENGDVFGINNR